MKKNIIKILVASFAICAICTTGISGNIALAVETASTINTDNDSQPNSNGYVFKQVNITGGGYIPSVIFNKSEKDVAYVRTDMGGAYRWNANEKKWVRMTDFINAADWNLNGCESIASDPVEPNRVYIFAGTYTNDWATQNAYILRSTDYGKNFDKIELPFKAGGNMPGRNMGERLIVDPNDNSILYLGARSGKGLWKSTDYGSTWAKVNSFPSVGDYADEYMKDPIGVVWIIPDQSSSSKGQPCQTIYAGVANKGKEKTIFVSKDGGNSWNPLEGQPTYDWEPTEKSPGNYMPGRATLASNGILYISYVNQEGPYNGNKGGVWKYDTKKNSWTNITPVKGDDLYFGYGGISVDASNPNIIMTTTLNSWYPDGNIYRSIDGGEHWMPLWEYDEDGERKNYFSIDYSASPWLDWSKKGSAPEISPKLGWMLGDVEIDPFDSNHFVYGTGATLYGSYNATNLDQGRKINIQVQAQGIEETAVLKLASIPSGDALLLSGTGDIGGFVHTDLDKSPHMLVNPTIGSCSGLDYAELNPNIMVRVGDAGVIGLSKDDGKTWMKPTGSINIGEAGGDYLTAGGTVAMSADGKTMLYSPNGKNAPLVYSHDDGATWKEANGIPSTAKICSDRVNSNKFYGTINGEFYVSNDGGENFEKTATGLNNKADISAMPGVEGDIWFAGGGIWHSTDSGKTFEKLSNVEDASVIGFGKAAPGKDYMSLYSHAKINGIDGIYRSDDKGNTWIRVNDDKHQYGAADTTITGDKRVYGRFYLGTNGLGIVYGELAK
ncbi:sialidase family protein [Clostridium beijerinckii]|uniref:sialidase family protein n=1 Tax=Clostridium beijerinckii TaxID=1520 RepID=UPI0014949291|nr:sialidase family protein [Clostridium beijerinckii]NOW06627.1 photosystem II stability/assembly factor-like uncharacterized protein [Clostridium beijerinckii]NYC00229.1 photosystem II stability/assembly factor-like uncharacterized protein [Clostridium beijerinckii]